MSQSKLIEHEGIVMASRCERCCTCRNYGLSAEELDALNNLRSRARIPFNQENSLHIEALKKLWSLAYPDKEFQLPDDNWKEMGFQSSNPSTDFRGSGMFGLEQLIHFGIHYETQFRHILNSDFPLAISGINMTYHLMHLFQLGETIHGLPNTRRAHPRVMKSFCGLLADNPELIDEIYSVTMLKMHYNWLEMKKTKQVTLMDFPECISITIDGLVRGLQVSPQNYLNN